jgi:uncharacterized membrane protein YecN with MAPEG domain
MFRFDGEVFLLGTAIAAPLKSIKIATICALSRQEPLEGDSRGGTRIVANRRSYSAWRRGCKGERRVRRKAMVHVPITLVTAAAAVFLNLWLGARVVSRRREFQVRLGDGGNEAVLRRMRAQANFVENAPLFLMLLGGLELSRANPVALASIAAIFIISRISHAIGMEGGTLGRWRMYGMMGSTFAIVALSVWALIFAAGSALRG